MIVPTVFPHCVVAPSQLQCAPRMVMRDPAVAVDHRLLSTQKVRLYSQYDYMRLRASR